MKILEGDALQEFASRRFRELAEASGLTNARCEILDADRGLRTTTGDGTATIVWPPTNIVPNAADYDPIENRRRSMLVIQLQTHVAVHVTKTFGRIGTNRSLSPHKTVSTETADEVRGGRLKGNSPWRGFGRTKEEP